MKSKILTIALILVLPFFLTACTLPLIGELPFGKKAAAPTEGPATLSMWGLWEDPELMKMVIEKYRQEHPNITINYEDRSVLKMEDYKETVYTRVAQGDAPDIIAVHNTWVRGLKDNLAAAPGDIVSPADYSQRFYNVASQSAVIDNNVYAMPSFYDGLVLVYNKEHFDEIDQQDPPASWEEFRRIALALTIRGDKNALVRGGAAIGTANNIDFASDILGLMLTQAKVRIPEDLDTRPAQDALVFYTNFNVEDAVWDDTMPEAATAFVSERVSMILVPSWNLLDIINARPDLDIGIAPVPQAIVAEPAAWASFWMTAVPSSSKNQKAAWDFINYLSKSEQQLQLFSEASKNRQYGAPFAATDLKGQLDSNEMLAPLIYQAPFAASGKIAARSGNKTAVEAIKGAINEVLNSPSRADPAEIMSKVKETVTNTR